MSNRWWMIVGAVVASWLFATSAYAGSTRDECLDAHGRGQDMRERGQLTRARQTFLACAQSSCPALVQQDCARLSEELSQLVPTVTFGARDAAAGDLPSTSVYVDDVLMTTRLDDGKAYEVDPGKHLVRYVHDGREATLKVIVNQGEKGRLLVATFVDRTATRRESAAETSEPASLEPSRSKLPLVVAGIGAAAAVTGGILFGVGSGKVPDACSMSTKECAAPPNDPAFEQAASGVRLANAGLAIGITGAVTLVGGIVWYFVQPPSSTSRRARLDGPVFSF